MSKYDTFVLQYNSSLYDPSVYKSRYDSDTGHNDMLLSFHNRSNNSLILN